MRNRKIVIFGPGPKFKGGIANYTLSLAKALDRFDDVDVHIISWTQQYPSIIPRDYIDRSSRTDLLEGTRIKVTYVTNYNNPFSWQGTVNIIGMIAPDIVIFQWALAVQGLPMGYIAKKIRKGIKCEVIFDLHVVAQKEGSLIDSFLLKYGLRSSDTYIVHSYKTFDELKKYFPNTKFHINETGERSPGSHKNVIKLFHPIYDMFKPKPDFDKEKIKRELNLRRYVFLFFGFIRKYKGLHNVIKSFARLAEKRDDVSLLIVGESFWDTLDAQKLSTKIKKGLFDLVKKILIRKGDDETEYRPLELIKELGISDRVTVVNTYVPNEDVHKYFQAADCNVLFYSRATPSGVESIAYNFQLPSIAANVGHFPETIQHGYNGYLAEAENIYSMYSAMNEFIDHPISKERVTEKAAHMSWKNYAEAILIPYSIRTTGMTNY